MGTTINDLKDSLERKRKEAEKAFEEQFEAIKSDAKDGKPSGVIIIRKSDMDLFTKAEKFLSLLEKTKKELAEIQVLGKDLDIDFEKLFEIDFQNFSGTLDEAYQKGLEVGKAQVELDELTEKVEEALNLETKKAVEENALHERYVNEGLINLINLQFEGERELTPFLKDALIYLMTDYTPKNDEEKQTIDDLTEWFKPENIIRAKEPVLEETIEPEPVLSTEKQEIHPVESPDYPPVDFLEIPSEIEEKVVEEPPVAALDVEKSKPSVTRLEKSDLRKVLSTRRYIGKHEPLATITGLYLKDIEDKDEHYSDILLLISNLRLNHRRKSLELIEQELQKIDNEIKNSSLNPAAKRRLYEKLARLVKEIYNSKQPGMAPEKMPAR